MSIAHNCRGILFGRNVMLVDVTRTSVHDVTQAPVLLGNLNESRPKITAQCEAMLGDRYQVDTERGFVYCYCPVTLKRREMAYGALRKKDSV